MRKNKKKKSRYSGIGGQAVLEGIMMKNKDKYSVAVRTPEGDIDVAVEEYESFAPAKALNRIPFIRGVFNFVDSLILGIRTLNYSAKFYEEEQDTHKKDKILYFIHYRRCHIAFFIICFRVQRYEKFRNIIRFDEKNLSNIRISLFSHSIKQSEGQPVPLIDVGLS